MSTRTAPFTDDLPERPKVLLVDDDEVNLLLTSVALTDQGFAVTEVASGEAAIRTLADALPDVVVLDAVMPGLDGFETCREMRGIPGFESLPVLMLTGLDDDASITRAYEAGATDFFVKSTQWSLLAGRLRYLLRASRTRVELERSKSRLARAQDLARMGSFDWRTGQGGPVFSIEGLRVFGLGPGARLNFRTLLRMLPEEERKAFLELTHNAMERSTVLATDMHARLVDGRQRIVHLEAEPEFNEHGNLMGYTGIVQDVTDRRMAEDRIRHLANFDTLTGLPNRRQLIWRAERALEHGRRLNHQVALLLIDLDRFKVINDTLGHGAGDELLMEVSRRLRSCVRHSDQVLESSLETVGVRSHRTLEAVGRLGGDEFVALLPEVADEADAERVAGRILDQMRQPIMVGMQECFVTASVGIAIFPRDGLTVADLLRNSDVAMYAVKSAGRNSASLYRPEPRRHRPREARARKRPAQGDRARRAGPALPAQDRRARRTHGRRRGADALAPSGRARAAGRLHSARRGDRADHPALRMGDPRGGAPGAHLAGQLRLRRLDRRQPAEPAVRAHRPGRVHPPCGDDLRRAAPRDRARDHRDGPDEGPAERDSGAAPAERDRRRDLDRRLRYRLLLACLPDDAADQRAQDRPQLRARSRHDAAELGGGHGDHRAGPIARPARGRRRRGKPPPNGSAAPTRLRHHAGVPVQQAADLRKKSRSGCGRQFFQGRRPGSPRPAIRMCPNRRASRAHADRVRSPSVDRTPPWT